MRKVPCPCCGHFVFEEPPGSFDICRVCFREDCGLQLEFATTLEGGPNGITFAEGQRNFAAFGTCESGFVADVRMPRPDESRDPSWRPIDPSLDRFEDWSNPEHRRAPANDDTLYYWRPTFWRRQASY